jgi:predicted ATPase/DNA-binding CsgD family transcriptional regulator
VERESGRPEEIIMEDDSSTQPRRPLRRATSESGENVDNSAPESDPIREATAGAPDDLGRDTAERERTEVATDGQRLRGAHVSTRLIGRERDLAQLHRLLLEPETRLLTLVGPPGVGKTRLALALAEATSNAFADGVELVMLAPLVAPELVVGAIAGTFNIAEAIDRPLIVTLVDHLRPKTLLMVLDNFEHVLPARSDVEALLTGCPGLKVLITSRAPTRLNGEREVPVAPLVLPHLGQTLTIDALASIPSVTLFLERARAVHPEFGLTSHNARAVAEICVRLDGLPLAIELAAARTRLLSPQATLQRLQRRFPLLTTDSPDLPERQRALRNSIAWSYDLLDPVAQHLVRRLSVFVGRWTVDAAEAISGVDGTADVGVLDALTTLVTQSLVQQTTDAEGESRFNMLETVREYAAERLLARGDEHDACAQHLDWCLELAERSPATAIRQGAVPLLDRLEAEHDNFRAALRWAADVPLAAERGLRLAAALARYLWPVRGHHREGRTWLSHLLARCPAPTAARGRGLGGAGYLAMRQNDYLAAGALFDEGLEVSRAAGDLLGVAWALQNLGVIAHQQHYDDRARTLLRESLELWRDIGDVTGVSNTLRNLADLTRDRHQYAESASAYEECLALANQHGHTHEMAYALRGLGQLAGSQGDYAAGGRLLRESLTLLAPLRDRRCIPLALEGLACTAIGPDWGERAARLFGAAHAMQQATGAPPPPVDMADYQHTETDAHALLGEEAFAALAEQGAAMTLDEIVGYALDVDANDHPQSIVSDTLASATVAPTGQLGVALTPREEEVAGLIAEGLSNRQIAEQLTLSLRTVERHIENIYNRLGISGKAARAIVSAYAVRHGLAEFP